MSPVAIAGIPYFAVILAACVPLPDPGGPSRTRSSATSPSCAPAQQYDLDSRRCTRCGRAGRVTVPDAATCASHRPDPDEFERGPLGGAPLSRIPGAAVTP